MRTIALRMCAAIAIFAPSALPPAAARGAQSASISAAFRPERLGAPTSVSLGFRVTASGGGVPSPLIGVDFRYPADLGFVTSGLGIATCRPEALEAHGPAGCPPDSRMGSGSAQAKFRIGPEVFAETASIGVVAGPSEDGYVRLLVSATGVSPVAARIVMSTLLLPGHLQFSVPLVPSLPGGEDVAVVQAQVTLGGDITYYERSHGRTVAYRPRGIGLPRRCPRGGFRFAATFSFLDGNRASARTEVRCPRASGSERTA
jgi:hypothetical protein